VRTYRRLEKQFTRKELRFGDKIMAIFLDSAMPEDVKRAQQLGFVAGITTNPVIIARAGRPSFEVLSELLRMFSVGPVFYQVTAPTPDGRVLEAKEAYSLAPGRIVIKVPAIPENLEMIPALAGIPVLVTCVFTAAQAYVAAQAGARYVAPYVHQITTDTGNGIDILTKMAYLLKGSPTEIVAANLTSVEEITDALLAGAHHVTLPLKLIEAMFTHEYSYRAISRFEEQVKVLVERVQKGI